MGVILKNNATSTITTAISASDVGLAVAVGTGSLFPTLGAGDYFYATLVSAGGTYEIIKVTARVGDTMTIVRAQEGTTAQSFVSGSRIEARVTAASVTDMVDEHDQASEIALTPSGYTTADDVQEGFDNLGSSSGTAKIGYTPSASYPSGSLGNFLNPFFGVSDAVFEVTTQAGVGLQRGISVEHYADTVGSYGVDIHQYQGAKNAFVVHCYSDENGAVAGAVAAQIDHTRHGNILVLKNAENSVTSPGTRGTANFLSFIGYGGSPQTTPKELGALTHQLAFVSYDPLYPYTFSGGLVAVAGTGHAQALKSTSLLDSLYAGEFYGTEKGVFVSTTKANSGFNLSVVKNGTGSGTLVGLVNSGFGDFLIGYNGSFAERAKIDSAGQYYVQGTRVLTTQQPFIADPAGGATVDTQARTAINSILDLLAAHGLMAPT